MKCIVNDCNSEGNRGFGYCGKHYQRFYKSHPNYNPRGEFGRNHPLYIIWWQRKSDNQLCEDWLDFNTFVKAISPKPEGNYFLVKIRDEVKA